VKYRDLRTQLLSRQEESPVTLEELDWNAGPANRGLYRLIRKFRPTTVVETGVWLGFSSAAILAALDENRNGRLWSIDLPTVDPSGRINADGMRDRVHVDRPELTGWAVSEELKRRWHLALGDSRQELEPLLNRLGSIDFFFHDSEHSREHMCFEFERAWAHLAPGGVLASDDVTWNDAFASFARSVGGRPHYWPLLYYLARRYGGRRHLPYRAWLVRPGDRSSEADVAGLRKGSSGSA
jgi:predicted O-methyltransferase YrrM